MNTARFLRIAIARWYVVLLGVLLTAGTAGALLLQAPTAYWAQTTVTLLQPEPNPLNTEGLPLSDLASALVLQVNGRPAETKTSSPDTALTGERVRKGTRVRIRDVGRQWATSIPDPVILVESVGARPAAATAHVDAQVERLRTALDRLQDDLGVDAANRIFLQAAPERPVADPVRGSRVRAAGAVGALGSLATGLALYFVDRRWPVRPRATEGWTP